eukprot:15480681-Alexandrium_andersonii.AAC.1
MIGRIEIAGLRISGLRIVADAASSRTHRLRRCAQRSAPLRTKLDGGAALNGLHNCGPLTSA